MGDRDCGVCGEMAVPLPEKAPNRESSCRANINGSLYYVGDSGYYWSCTPYGDSAYYLCFYGRGDVNPSTGSSRAYGQPVRCLSE